MVQLDYRSPLQGIQQHGARAVAASDELAPDMQRLAAGVGNG